VRTSKYAHKTEIYNSALLCCRNKKKYSALQEINFTEINVSYKVSALYRVLCTVMEDN
jgi:hypothetical protein